MLKPNIQDDTALRVQKLTGQPLTRGFDQHINKLCDEVEEQRNENNHTPNGVKKLDCMCDQTKEALKQNGS
ncbi:MAG: hypothetical protein NPMRTHETA2_1260016 [Nitrosopumilales archaeon]|nr:MAG: hypothetical protein NPMRTHETA2_1260016 [Nitrosopumilales archaeon]